MGFVELLLIAVGLAMDAFAVSVCKGLAVRQGTGGEARNVRLRASATAGVWFGGFQALMPLLGYLLGSRVLAVIEDIDHWIAFGLLALIGGNMLREALKGKEENVSADLRPLTMFLLAVATSIDALAVGITFAVLRVQIAPAVTLIGAVTFVISAAGVRVGCVFGARWRRTAEIAGGLILIAIGLRILLTHLLLSP